MAVLLSRIAFSLSLTFFFIDHYGGLEPGFNFGKVYCSEITKCLALDKFPGIVDIVPILHSSVIMGVIYMNRRVFRWAFGTKSI